MERITMSQTVAEWNQGGKDFLPGYLGMEFLAVESDEVVARMRIELHLHAGAVVWLADTAGPEVFSAQVRLFLRPPMGL